MTGTNGYSVPWFESPEPPGYVKRNLLTTYITDDRRCTRVRTVNFISTREPASVQKSCLTRKKNLYWIEHGWPNTQCNLHSWCNDVSKHARHGYQRPCNTTLCHIKQNSGNNIHCPNASFQYELNICAFKTFPMSSHYWQHGYPPSCRHDAMQLTCRRH